ncbi:MAG: hypothetical protein ETSY2_38965 [Candidatus Entotheonella gemina]|uniref:Uncharacterized protein n=1 Tax=Candidatus Entotheonella gemina TaxID=1429439 RepID=W4LR09_9BACT|nr:MAG: hypothetical protein ETSY2_38965 [Candidatus Entotheonella gemina]
MTKALRDQDDLALQAYFPYPHPPAWADFGRHRGLTASGHNLSRMNEPVMVPRKYLLANALGLT